MHWIVRMYTYFRRGWGLVAIPVAFINFDLITYRLLVEHVPFLKHLFPSLWVYTVVLAVVGVPVLIVAGYLDMKRGTAPFETARISRYSPWHKGLMRALYLMADGRVEDAKRELRRWFDEDNL